MDITAEANLITAIGQKVKALREDEGWSQRAVAVQAGISLSALCRIEQGTHLPNLKILCKIAHAFKVPVRELMP